METLTRSDSILVIDDEIAVCSLMKEFLGSSGYDVAVAYDGLEGLSKIKERMPGLVFLDLKMPRMNGFELMEAVREINPDLPIVIISAIWNKEVEEDCLKKGARGFIRKPIKLEELEQFADQLL